MSLRFVGPATTDVLEEAPFDARDIVAKRVSYRDLIDAGVNPGVAERLRREYSLVWSFVWIPGGGDLRRRADRLRVLGDAERAWIAASADGHEYTPRETPAETRPESDGIAPLRARDWPAVEPDEPAPDDEGVCPRCAADTVTYALGDTESEFCEACGFAGVTADLSGDRPAWQTAFNRLLYGNAIP